MKKFRFKYSATVWLLLSLVLLLSLGGLIWNVFNLVQFSWAGTFKITVYSLIIAFTGLLFLFVLSVVFYGRYVVKGEFLYTFFGVIKSKVEIKSVIQITHFKKSDKLVVYFNDQKYTVIVIAPEFYDEFIAAIRKVNPAVICDARYDEENTAI